MPTVSEYRSQTDDLSVELEKAQRRISQLETEAMQAQAAAERATIESHLRLAAFAAGSAEGPAEAAVADAMRSVTWKVDSKGRLVRVLPDGQYDMTPSGQPVTATAWMRQYAKTMPSYFPHAKPAGAPGAAGTSGTSSPPQGFTGPNPWSREHWNLTEQSKYMLKEGREKAEAMAAAAGSPVNATHPPAAL
jgi:hypothetical protein